MYYIWQESSISPWSRLPFPMNEIWSYANFQKRWSSWERKLSINKFIIPNVKNIWKKKLFNKINDYTEPTYRNHSKQYCLIKMLEKWKYLLAEISHCCAFYGAIKSNWLTKPFPAYKVGCIWIFSKIPTFMQSYLNKKDTKTKC